MKEDEGRLRNTMCSHYVAFNLSLAIPWPFCTGSSSGYQKVFLKSSSLKGSGSKPILLHRGAANKNEHRETFRKKQNNLEQTLCSFSCPAFEGAIMVYCQVVSFCLLFTGLIGLMWVFSAQFSLGKKWIEMRIFCGGRGVMQLRTWWFHAGPWEPHIVPSRAPSTANKCQQCQWVSSNSKSDWLPLTGRLNHWLTDM